METRGWDLSIPGSKKKMTSQGCPPPGGFPCEISLDGVDLNAARNFLRFCSKSAEIAIMAQSKAVGFRRPRHIDISLAWTQWSGNFFFQFVETPSCPAPVIRALRTTIGEPYNIYIIYTSIFHIITTQQSNNTRNHQQTTLSRLSMFALHPPTYTTSTTKCLKMMSDEILGFKALAHILLETNVKATSGTGVLRGIVLFRLMQYPPQKQPKKSIQKFGDKKLKDNIAWK